MTTDETRDRVMLLTPPGVGAIAVVRLIGKKVEPFLQLHFSAPTYLGRATHGRLTDGDETIDDPLIARPSELIADINLHGGTWLVQRFIDIAVHEGFDHLEPTLPLSLDAVDGGDFLESEMLAWLPSAQTDKAIRFLLAQPENWQRLRREPIDRQKVAQAISDRSLHWMLNMPTVAIVGPPNVGKSTLANQLFGRDRSITADVPGTTRDWVGEVANIDGLAVMLIDTPGLHETNDPIEGEAIERSKPQIERADLVILVSEAGQESGASSEPSIMQFRIAVRVNNKMDRGVGGGVNTNALTGEGIDELRRAIRWRFDCEPMDLSKACCWTERQRDVLRSLLV